MISSWSIGGLFLSLGPALSASCFHTDNHLVAGLGVFALAGAGAAAQLAFGRTAPWAGAAGGSLALATGMIAIVLAADRDARAVLGRLADRRRRLRRRLPRRPARAQRRDPAHSTAPRSCRPSTSSPTWRSRFPAILAGALVEPLGLETTFELFGSVVAALALAVAAEAWRTRPAPARLAVETA